MHAPIEFLDNHGLICGFLIRPQFPPQALEWGNLAEALVNDEGTVWLHFNLADSRARKWVATCERIPEAAKEMLLAPYPHIHLEVVGKGFVSILGDLHYEFNADPDSLGLLRMYVDSGFLVSVRGRPLKAVDRLRQELMHGEPIETSLDLVVHFLQYSTEILSNVIFELRAVVDDMEDQVLKGNFQEKRGELGVIRRSFARLSRHINGNLHALSHHLLPRLPSWCRETDIAELRRDIERQNAIAQDLELVQERARLLQEEMSGQLQETLNRNLYVLSLVTIFFLPVTLITGIFGMNVGGVPWLQEQIGFWWVILTMGITLALTFMVLKRQRFF